MSAVDIAITVVVCVAVAAVIGWFIYRKIKHKNIGCDCGCGSCGGCSACNSKEKEEK